MLERLPGSAPRHSRLGLAAGCEALAPLPRLEQAAAALRRGLGCCCVRPDGRTHGRPQTVRSRPPGYVVTVRVIAGSHGGRSLKAPPGRKTRPTSDRVREALFSMLGDIQDLHALDLFAGTGALGIEALSRGAAHVVFVERDARALKALRGNLATLQISRDRTDVRRANALAVLQEAAEQDERYDLVFVDPPYAETPALGPKLSVLLAPVLAPEARIVTESDRRSPLAIDAPIATERRYGDTSITIHEAPCPGPSAR